MMRTWSLMHLVALPTAQALQNALSDDEWDWYAESWLALSE